MSFPALFIDETKARINIQKMARKVSSGKLEFRPHFKTHQSHVVGNWFREAGVSGITVSSLRMARYFAHAGWKDITIAFPVNILEAEKLDDLAGQITLNVLAVDKETLVRLNESLSNTLGIYIELDPGYGRSGIPVNDHRKLEELKEYIEGASQLKFAGLYTHAGHSYKCRSVEEIKALAAPILEKLALLKSTFGGPVCFGDTPSCSVLEDFEPVDQLSPGNLVFYDWMQVNIGSCSPENIAVAMYCPVVAKYKSRNELLVHGGAVHFSKDSILNESGIPSFGVVAQSLDNGWGNPVPGAMLKSISQEHGIISCTKEFFDSVHTGDVIPVLPIHSCLTADLMGGYVTAEGATVDHMNKKAFPG